MLKVLNRNIDDSKLLFFKSVLKFVLFMFYIRKKYMGT